MAGEFGYPEAVARDGQVWKTLKPRIYARLKQGANVDTHAAIAGILTEVFVNNHAMHHVNEFRLAIVPPALEALVCAPDDGAGLGGIALVATSNHGFVKGISLETPPRRPHNL